jgi:hypothetical protein
VRRGEKRTKQNKQNRRIPKELNNMESFFFLKFIVTILTVTWKRGERDIKNHVEYGKCQGNVTFQRKGPCRAGLLRHVEKAKNLAPDAESLQGEVLPKNVELVASPGQRANGSATTPTLSIPHSLLSRVKCRWNLETNSCSTSQR